MPDTTATYGLPFPEDSDPTDVPMDIENLAEAVEDELILLDGRLDVVEPIVTALNLRRGGTWTVNQTYTTDATLVVAGSTVAWVEVADNGGFGSAGVNAVGPVVIPSGEAGIYGITARAAVSPSAVTGRSFLDIEAGGVLYRAPLAVGENIVTVTAIAPLAVANTVGVKTFHTKGNATLNTAAVTLHVYKLSP